MADDSNNVDVTIKLGSDITGGIQTEAELEKIRAKAKQISAESSAGFNSFGKSIGVVSKAAGTLNKILSGFGVIGIFTTLISGLEKLSSLFSENAGKARELNDAARAEELTKSVSDLAAAYEKVKQGLQDAAKEQNNVLELIDAEVKSRRALEAAKIDAAEQKELDAVDADSADAEEQKKVIRTKYEHLRSTKAASNNLEDLVLQRQKYTTAAELDDAEAKSAETQASALREQAKKFSKAASEEGANSMQLNERDRNGFIAKFAGNIKDIVTLNWGNKFGQDETAEGDEIRKAQAERQKEYIRKAEELEKQAEAQDHVAKGKRDDATQKRKLADAMNGSVEAAQIGQKTTQVKESMAERDAASALSKKQAEEARKAKELADAKALLASGEGQAAQYRSQIAANNREIKYNDYKVAANKMSTSAGSEANSKLEEHNLALQNLLNQLLKKIDQANQVIKKANEQARNSRGVDSTEGA